MRKLIDRIKSIRFDWKIFLVVVILIINFILIFKPNIFKNKSSYASIKTKKSMLNETNKDIVQEIDGNNNKTMEVGSLRERDAEHEKRALRNKKEIDINGLNFHLPSILIRLEDSARANSLDLSISYSEIAYQNLEGEDIDITDEEVEELEEKEEVEEPEEVDEKEESKEDEALEEEFLDQQLLGKLKRRDEEESEEEEIKEEAEKESDEEDEGTGLKSKSDIEAKKKIEEEMKKEKDNASNVEVTKIPIKVTGTYAGVRGFINDLDRLNYIEPTKIEMDSTGDIVNASITISVFHGNIFE